MATATKTIEMTIVDGHGARRTVAVPQAAAIPSLTDNTGSTPDSTLEDCNNAVTGVNGTGNNAASKADVDTRLVSISNNLSDLGAKQNAILAALRSHGIIASA